MASGANIDLPFIEVTPEASNIGNYNSSQKNSYPHGNGFVSVKIANTSTRNHVIRKFREHTPIYDLGTFSNAPNGVYVYLLSDRGFYAIQVRSHLELGTKHKILAKETGASKVFIAGELSKDGKNVVYNLLSGTYTRHLVDDNTTGTLIERMRDMIESILRSMGLTPTFKDKSFIGAKQLRLTDPELRLYKDMGYEVRFFPKEGFCSEVELVSLRGTLGMHERTLELLRGLKAEKTRIDKELADIAKIKATLAGAEECVRRSTLLEGGAFTNGKRKNRRETKKARKHRHRYSRSN